MLQFNKGKIVGAVEDSVSIVKYTTKYEYVNIGDHVIFTGNNRETNKYIYEVRDKYIDASEGIRLRLRKIVPEVVNSIDNTRLMGGTLDDKFFHVIHVEKLSEATLLKTVNVSNYEEYRELAFTNSSEPYFNDKQEKTTMKNTKNQAVRANVDAAKTAALITAGGVINQTVLFKLRPQLPMLMRGYVDHPLAGVILANIANFAIANFAKDNDEAVLATEAMMLAAMTKLTTSFNFESILTDILADVKLPDVKVES